MVLTYFFVLWQALQNKLHTNISVTLFTCCELRLPRLDGIVRGCSKRWNTNKLEWLRQICCLDPDMFFSEACSNLTYSSPGSVFCTNMVWHKLWSTLSETNDYLSVRLTEDTESEESRGRSYITIGVKC